MTPRLTVDLDAIAANWRTLARIHQGDVAAVVKADAYGLGAEAVAQRLHAEGARHFFTAHLPEAIRLRPLLPSAAIAVLNGFAREDGEHYLAHDLLPVIGSMPELIAARATARAANRRLPVALHADTGMHRLGLEPAELALVARDPAWLDWIEPRTLMSHLAHAETPNHPANGRQLVRFRAAAEALPGVPTSLVNSSGIFLGGGFRAGLARPGAALYGINPTPGLPNPMRPALRLTARVVQTRAVREGETVGYNGIWTARRPTRVATVALGYADGYHRALSNRAEAFFDGARLPLIGRVSMDLTTFDATDHPRLVAGHWLELIGPAIPPEELAALAGTNGYEILTSLGPRVSRSYAPL